MHLQPNDHFIVHSISLKRKQPKGGPRRTFQLNINGVLGILNVGGGPVNTGFAGLNSPCWEVQFSGFSRGDTVSLFSSLYGLMGTLNFIQFLNHFKYNDP
jgi:hypothetical protein